MGRGLRVFGGLLSGIGTGVSAQAAAVRERALKQMEEDAANARQQQMIAAEATQHDLDRAHATDLSDAQIKSAQTIDTNNQAGALARTNLEVGGRSKDVAAEVAGRSSDAANEIAGRRGLLKTTFVDDDTGNLNTITEGGVIKDTGKKPQAKDVTAQDKFALDAVMKSSISKPAEVDPDTQKIIVPAQYDTDAIASKLAKSTSKVLKGMAPMFAAGEVPTGLDVDPDAPASATVTPDGTTTINPAPATGGTRGLQPPAAASGSDDVDLKSKADQIRADYKSGKISKDEANRQLNALYPQQ